ncbi:zona pellucida-like domain-containing protein 1 [Salminus brasiliensis]|uniref:zona pellucida-like domain-containing protein 1 n=1 Tax=Salminus brasiliensis TaxID=930266 RepID=UPI003B8386A9
MQCTLLVCLTTLIGHCMAQTGYNMCSLHSTFRPAASSDITVTCGANNIYLSILLCPIYFRGYNESFLALNGRFNVSTCQGMADFNGSTPVLKFHFSISQESMSLCGNSIEIVDEVDVGQLPHFSRVQLVNFSGSVRLQDAGTSPITHHQDLLYQFSCRYPLQYMVNNTEVSMSGLSLTVKENRGSFVSTLSMNLYTNRQYTQPLQIPDGGLQLKTRIYVQVKATDLTNRLNVLLDRCYATTDPYPLNSTYYNLFAGCSRDGQTVVDLNGVSQEARFSFEVFRFLESQNMSASTFYLHCATRLCEKSTCSSMLPNCAKRVKREVQAIQNSSKVETVSSGPIKTKADSGGALTTSTQSALSPSESSETVVAVAILMCLLSVCTTCLVVFILVYKKRRCVIHY